MEKQHWTYDELLDKLYGIASDDAAADSHLASCEDCSGRWGRLTMQRKSIVAKPEVPVEVLAAQRRAIYARMEARPVAWWQAPFSQKGFATGFAALLLIAGGLAFLRPAPAPAPMAKNAAQVQQPEVSDAEFFAEIASVEQSTMPRAAAPIQALFQAQSQSQ
jgi:hypothetical protein